MKIMKHENYENGNFDFDGRLTSNFTVPNSLFLVPLDESRTLATTHPIALGTPLSKLLLVAGHAHELVVTGDETLVADRMLAHPAPKTLLVPLLSAKLKLLHSCWRNMSS